MSSQVARLKAEIDARKKVQPGHHEQRVRTQAERERIQVETAKKMAARFNLTYRALALAAAKKAAEERKRDLEAARQAKEAAAKFNMTARALKMSSTGTAKGRVNVLNTPSKSSGKPDPANGNEPASTSAQPYTTQSTFKTLEELAKEQNENQPSQDPYDQEEIRMLSATKPSDFEGAEEEDAVGELKKRDEDDGSVVVDDRFDVLSRITEATREQDHEEHDAFWMPTLATALKTGNDDAINIAVVKSFFEEHDPSRVDEAVELVAAHKGREEQLMEALNEQYPPVNDVKDLVEEPVEEIVKPSPAEAQKAAAIKASRPPSTRITGLKLSVKLEEGLAVPSLEASVSAGGESGYILSGIKADRKSVKFVVNPTSEDAVQARQLRERMAQKGLKADVIDAVVGDTSEML